MRENATMLFAATSDVFASIGCLSKQVSVTPRVPRRNHCAPMSGSEENRTPVRNVGDATYMSFKVLHQDFVELQMTPFGSPDLHITVQIKTLVQDPVRVIP